MSHGVRARVSASMAGTQTARRASGAVQIQNAKHRIARAIQVGAPLYNAGDRRGCAEIYRQCYETLLREEPSDKVTSILRSQLANLKTDGPGTAEHNAWQLRHGLDAVLSLPTPEDEPAVDTAEVQPARQTSRALLVTDDLEAVSRFKSVDDRVMGGVSFGRVSYCEETSSALYSGNVATENNGGFSSIRAQSRFPSARNYTGIYIDCMSKDPSMVFQFVAKDMDAMQSLVSFKARFRAPREFGRVFIPFTAFDTPERMGQPVVWPNLNLSELSELGFMVIKPSVGPFNIRFKEIGLYRMSAIQDSDVE